VVIAFQLVVEYHPRDARAGVLQLRPLGFKEAIELSIMGQFTRLHQPCVVLLLAPVHRFRVSVGLQKVLSGLRQDQHPLRGLVDDDRAGFDQALLRKSADIVRQCLEITFSDHPEGPHGRKQMSLRIPQPNAFATKSDVLAVGRARE
jgi:hypothetical protein